VHLAGFITRLVPPFISEEWFIITITPHLCCTSEILHSLSRFSVVIATMYTCALCCKFYHYITLNLLLPSSICLLSNSVILLTVVRLTACNVSHAAL